MSTQPVIAVVSDDAGLRQALADDVRSRFASDYDVRALSGRAAAGSLGDGADVAVVVVSVELDDGAGVDLLDQVHAAHPTARRVLLVNRGEWRTHPVRHAMVLGRADGYLFVPWAPREQWLHLPLTEYLADWSRGRPPEIVAATVVGRRWDERSHQLRDLFSRASVPFDFLDADSAAGRQRLDELGAGTDRLPVVGFYTGETLVDPSDHQIVDLLGFPRLADHVDCDVAIVGAGPSGLSAAVYAASEGLRTVVVDPGVPGGQAGTSSRIRNYLGFARGISGAELTNRAVEQAWLFGAELLLAERVVSHRRDRGRHVLLCASGGTVTASAVVVATGVDWRRLRAPGIEELVGSGVFYGAAGAEADALSAEDVFVVGGGNSAGQAAVHLAKHAASVTVLIRGADLAVSMSDYLVQELAANPRIALRTSTEVVGATGQGRLQALRLRDRSTGEIEQVPAAAVFVMIGAEPRTEWLDGAARDDAGYLLTGEAVAASGAWPLERAPLFLETSLAGVFAVGDVGHDATRRVAPAVGSGAISIQLVHRYLRELAAQPRSTA